MNFSQMWLQVNMEDQETFGCFDTITIIGGVKAYFPRKAGKNEWFLMYILQFLKD